ncbi:MAG: hypothetical protein Q9227_002283 [Pyrenula ochraceoflavens]
MLSDLDQRLGRALQEHPSKFHNSYDGSAQNALLEILFRALTNDNQDYLQVLFPQGLPQSYKLSDAQGSRDGSEYTPAARGHPCGHILRQGEASYKCKTCSDDDTACLCSRCFDASDHDGHNYSFSISPGNTGCCDCGDDEAWKAPVNCAIHTAVASEDTGDRPSILPDDLCRSIRTTIGRVLDYFCDVISCSPEQLRLPKSMTTIQLDEASSVLSQERYGPEDDSKNSSGYALVLWNDEKHTVDEVQEQVARACKQRLAFGLQKANEVNDIGRAVVKQSHDLPDLLKKAAIIEQIKVTVTIRSARDTFREQMCGTIIEWLSDIAGCSVGQDSRILRYTICEEMLKPWRIGSAASNARIGRQGLDDHENEDRNPPSSSLVDEHHRGGFRRIRLAHGGQVGEARLVQTATENGNAIAVVRFRRDDEGETQDGTDEDDGDDEADVEDQMDIDVTRADDSDDDMDIAEEDPEIGEATRAGMAPPPFPPVRNQSQDTQAESDLRNTGDDFYGEGSMNYRNVPKLSRASSESFQRRDGQQLREWDVKPQGYGTPRDLPYYEDIQKNIRLDSMILFDLRLWKKTRIELRDLLISTVVNIPAFKRILGLRFAGLYTPLSQLYLIADREPDHSIINLSLQMLTTQSITAEVMERGNFLTNLMAILYTFLTSRQVGYPEDVSTNGTLAFDAGSVANRRLYHFFSDMRFFLGSEAVQKKVRTESQYLLQFLDLAKLCQGICPNVRAVGEHVEYETDAWISASLLTREINKLCRQFAESYRQQNGKDADTVSKAIYESARVAILNSSGLERTRFDQSEIKEPTKFKLLRPFEFENLVIWQSPTQHRVVDFVVSDGALSFHHALHYTLSWLIECGKAQPAEQLKHTLFSAAQEFLERHRPSQSDIWKSAEDTLMALFDFPLRVCAWLAQMKAGMWVRNGLSLRHQMSQYKGVQLRDVAHLRDIFLLQSALVTCNPSRVLASIIDRFGMDDWMRGAYIVKTHQEDSQLVDVAEDMIHLLIVLLSERNALLTLEDEPRPRLATMRKDIIHTLCFKPLSFSDLAQRLHERYQELEEFSPVLEEMTNYRAPEGLTDSGMFELKPEYLESLDPYNVSYNKNQRDEAENIYKSKMSKKTSKKPEDIVLEPRLRSIRHGAFKELSSLTNSALFAQVMYYALGYALAAEKATPNVPRTRVEAYLHVVLHLILIATYEDSTVFEDFTEESMESFVYHALKTSPTQQVGNHPTIISQLQQISRMDSYASCSAKIKHILRLFCRKRQSEFKLATANLDFPYERLDTSSPATVDSDVEAKKKLALERQAKVLAQFQQQQQKFMDNQGVIDWGTDLSDEEADSVNTAEKKAWKYPTGVCILCQEETNDSRLYGTFALIMESHIARQTDTRDVDWVREALRTPASLDRSADGLRPFGVAGENHERVRKLKPNRGEIFTHRQGLGKGFPPQYTNPGPVSTGCGHIMHYTCFETYCAAISRRQTLQIARNHPERLKHNEFVCPLCKALGNTFLPIVWKGKEESYPGVVEPKVAFSEFLSTINSRAELIQHDRQFIDSGVSPSQQEMFRNYAMNQFVPGLANSVDRVASVNPTSPMSPSGSGRLSLPSALSSIFFSPTEDASAAAAAQFNPRTSESEVSPTTELMQIYRRIRITIRNNNLANYLPLEITGSRLEYVDSLASSVGFSITAMEIAQRGLESQPGNTFLDRIPQNTLTHLRILAETVFSYTALGSLRGSGPHTEGHQLRVLQNKEFYQLFVPSAPAKQTHPSLPPLLTLDTFNFLTECSLILCPLGNIEIHHVLQLCYTAELVRAVLAFLASPASLLDESIRATQNNDLFQGEALELRCFSGAVNWFYSELQQASGPGSPWIGSPFEGAAFQNKSEGYSILYRLVYSYSLPFLRKSVVLLHTRYGVDFPSAGLSDLDKPELERLSQIMRLPSMSDIFRSLSPIAGESIIKSIVRGWIHDLTQSRAPNSRDMQLGKEHPLGIFLDHPAILELVGLPKFYDVLLEECQARKCPTTGKELTDPSVCLFCGDIFCSQAVCCMVNKRGGCNLHMKKCGGSIGLFLNIRKCTVLFMHHDHGSWYHAPYLTKHGEVDPGLRQRHQLILNQKRYDRLIRDVWLSHGVCSMISRKLEGDVNNGGWETI